MPTTVATRHPFGTQTNVSRWGTTRFSTIRGVSERQDTRLGHKPMFPVRGTTRFSTIRGVSSRSFFASMKTEGLHFTSSGKLFHIIDPQNVIDLFPCSVFTFGRTNVLVSFCLVP